VSLWRVEWLRLFRTGRWIALAAVFLVLGFAEPLLTRYLGQLLSGATGSTYIHITVTEPQASDAMAAYFGNITTLGTLVTVVIAGLAFSIRANPPLAALYLTHVPGRVALLLPRLLAVAVAAGVAAALGGTAAAYETTLLISRPAVGATATGVLVSCLGTVFAVTITFLATTFLRGQVAAIAIALGAMFVAVPFANLIPGVRAIGPAAFTALPTSLQTVAWSTDDTWATAVTMLLAAACVAGGLWQSTRWEL
jgi:ABC-2 type transport system permease protein